MLPAVLFSPLARIVAVAVLGVAVFTAGYYRGHSASERDHKAALAEELQIRINEVMNANERANKIAADFAEWKRKHSGKANGYRAAAADLRGCSFPVSFVRLYNASASASDVPASPSGIACEAATTPADTVATIVAENNSACVEYAEQLNKLIDFEEGRK